jgi:hypothetical protein
MRSTIRRHCARHDGSNILPDDLRLELWEGTAGQQSAVRQHKSETEIEVGGAWLPENADPAML